jgi:hypothetical protein
MCGEPTVAVASKFDDTIAALREPGPFSLVLVTVKFVAFKGAKKPIIEITDTAKNFLNEIIFLDLFEPVYCKSFGIILLV